MYRDIGFYIIDILIAIDKIKLNDAIENAKKDFTYNKEILNFLNNLKDKL